MHYGITYRNKHSSEFGVIAKTKGRSLLPDMKTSAYDMPLSDGEFDFSEANEYKRAFYKQRNFEVLMRICADNMSELQKKAVKVENCGKGEIYIDNYNIALVERIGRDSGVRLELDRNLESVTVERDITEMVTRLYPYGPNDEHIGSVAEGCHYVDSPNTEAYGIMAGYKNYDAIEGADDSVSVAAKLKAMAEWEFAKSNENRIDVPSVSISGRLVDISKLEEYGDVYKVRLGDTVTVIDNGVEIKERVTAIETYPYEAKSGSITIGKVQKNLFFYLDQLRHRVNMKGR